MYASFVHHFNGVFFPIIFLSSMMGDEISSSNRNKVKETISSSSMDKSKNLNFFTCHCEQFIVARVA
jgi:hypothetical protein